MDPILLALNNQRRRQAPPRPTGPRPPAPRPPAAGAPAAPPPPDFSELLAELARGPKQRSEEEWAKLLDERTRPMIDAIEGSTLRARAFNEYNLETKAAASRGLADGFMAILTGGKTGDEAVAFMKENFGSQYLGGQAMYIAERAVSALTADFDQNDWKITSDYLDAMQEIPGVRETLRENMTRADADEHTRKVSAATLLIDEAWRAHNAAYSKWDADRKFSEDKRRDSRDFKEDRRRYEIGIRTAQKELAARRGVSGYEERQDAVSEAREMSDQTGRQWTVARGEDGSWLPVDTGKRLPQKAGSNANAVRARNSALTEARDMTKGTGNVWRVRRENGAWVAYDTGQRAKGEAGQGSDSSKLSEAQKAERDLAVAILTDHRATIMGATSPSGVRSRGMSYAEAYDYIYSLAEAELGPYRRSSAYLNKWVKDRLRALGLIRRTPADPKPQGG